jgi:hypothetical protein
MAFRLLVAAVLVSFTKPAIAEPGQVILIRHAEKPSDGHHLSLAGRERAAALVPYFQEAPDVTELGPPVAIYAQKSTEANKSHRPVETVAGLVRALKVEVRQFGHEDFKAMIHEIVSKADYEGKLVLVCWEHRALPDLARELGIKEPPTWPDKVFDRAWVIRFKDGKAHLKNLPQRLMFGDSRD